MNAARITTLLLLGACLGCPALSDDKVERLVRAYNTRVIDAYRTSDPQLVETVAGPDESRRILALVGVKADQGLTLDAELVELVMDKVERTEEKMTVTTHERWHYVDRRIGSGEQVGEASNDSYVMRYDIQKVEGRWKVMETHFAADPVVSRKQAPNQAPAEILHNFGTTRAPTPSP